MKLSPISKNVLIVIFTVSITIVGFYIYQKITYSKENQMKLENLVFDPNLVELDSTATYQDSLFLDDTETVEHLMKDYMKNNSSFDAKYKGVVLTFKGTISEITNESNCAQIAFKIYDETNDFKGYVYCSNCPAGEDKWKNEVANLSVGDYVKIQGYYNGNGGSDEMSFYKCHVVK